MELLNDLTIGLANLRRLLKTEEIQLIFKDHSVSNFKHTKTHNFFLQRFAFVCDNSDCSIMRTRSNFYSSLMRLLNIEMEDEPAIFEMFMKPINGRSFFVENERFFCLQKSFKTFESSCKPVKWRMSTRKKSRWRWLDWRAICAELSARVSKRTILQCCWIGREFFVVAFLTNNKQNSDWTTCSLCFITRFSIGDSVRNWLRQSSKSFSNLRLIGSRVSPTKWTRACRWFCFGKSRRLSANTVGFFFCLTIPNTHKIC